MSCPDDPTAPMDGRTCLVTGANSGIGKETTRQLARKGAHVIMLCRDEDKAQRARDELAADTGSDTLSVVLADLGEPDQVEQAAYEVASRHDRLDVLVNNAGAVLDDRALTSQGNEMQFAVNHLGPFLLTHELLDLLQAAGRAGDDPARVVNVASEAHWNAKKLPDGFQSLEGRYSSFGVYSQTKLYNILFTRGLARRLDPSVVTANCLHPGVIGSNFGSGGPWYVRAFMKLASPFLTAPEDGARTSLYLATQPSVADVTGTYFKGCEPAATSKLAQDDELARELWRVSEALTAADGWPSPSP